MNEWAILYEKMWSLLAIAMGCYAFFFTKTFNERNARSLERWYRKTNFSFFKTSATKTRGFSQFLVTKIVGAGFLILGILLLLGVITFHS